MNLETQLPPTQVQLPKALEDLGELCTPTAIQRDRRARSEKKNVEENSQLREALELKHAADPVSPVLQGKAVVAGAPITEKPWHRTAQYLVAAGYTIKDAAEACHCSEGHMRDLVRAPWFQAGVTRIIHSTGGSDIMVLIKAQQQNALNTLVELMSGDKVPAAVKANCAKDILDRTLGRATQRIEHSGAVASTDPVSEAAQLEAELARLREARVGGPN